MMLKRTLPILLIVIGLSAIAMLSSCIDTPSVSEGTPSPIPTTWAQETRSSAAPTPVATPSAAPQSTQSPLSPSVAKKVLDAYVALPTQAPTPCDHEPPQYETVHDFAEPVIVSGIYHSVLEMGSRLPPLRVCGYAGDQVPTLVLTDPLGQVVLEESNLAAMGSPC